MDQDPTNPYLGSVDQQKLQESLGTAYRIDRELGGGGMSRVYVAQDVGLQRHVVVKILAPDLAQGLSVERFRREIQIAARLQHPNIVTLLSAGDAGGVPFYTMPFVEGETLRARLTRTGELPLRDALSILRDIARALAHAHAHGVVHRDIKPENVLLAEDYAMVTDFGVSKAIAASLTAGGPKAAATTLTQFGMALGTPGYMAPEQASGDVDVDQRADIYAFGVLAYEMLTGEPPFRGRNAQALIAAHLTETPVELSTRRAAVPQPLADLVMRCLEKRPADRPQDAEELVRALDAVTATPAVSKPKVARRGMVIAAIFAFVFASGALNWFFRSRPSLDENLIVVTPFHVSSADPQLRVLREGIPDLVYAKLTGNVRGAHRASVMNAWRRAGGSDSQDPDEDALLGIARSFGAGRQLDGTVIQNANGQLDVTATLRAVRGGQSWTARASGQPTAIAFVIDTLVSRLVAQSAGENEQRVSALAGTPFEALQSYLVGEAAFRNGNYVDALAAFKRAVAADSTFALAALRQGIVDSWLGTGTAGPMLELARRHIDKLPPSDRYYITTRPDGSLPTSLAESFQDLERAVVLSPDTPELWYRLADNLHHLGPMAGIEDAGRRAVAAFERAVALDSTMVMAMEHLPQLYAEAGDTARALKVLERFPASSEFRDAWLAMLGRGEYPWRHWVNDIAPAGSRNLLTVMAWYGNIAAAESALVLMKTKAVTADAREAANGLEADLAFLQGQPTRGARVRIASAASPDVIIGDYLFNDGDSTLAKAAADKLRPRLDVQGDTTQAGSQSLFMLAEYDLAKNKTETAERASALLRRQSASSRGADSLRRLRYATMLDAHLAVIKRAPDATTKLAEVDSLVRLGQNEMARTVFETAGGIILMRLWETQGDIRRARAAALRIRMNTGTPLPYYATYIRGQARLGEALGDREEAIKAYRKYVRLRNPEPSLVADRDAAQKSLDRLLAQSAGK